MKRHALWILAAASLLLAAACAGGKAPESEQVVQGTGKGHGGAVTVAVTLSGDRIRAIKILSSDETAALGDAAAEELTRRVVAANSAEVDVVSGATDTSEGFLDAVKDALKKANFRGARAAAKAEAAARDFGGPYDVVVVGSGGAGLSAALAASQAGAKVAVFEKMGVIGGNTLRATGGLNAAGTPVQKAKGIVDSPDLFFADTMKGGYNKNDPALVRNLAEKSAETWAWLTSLGGDFSDVGRLAGASVDRAHRPSGGGKVGPEIVKTLRNQVLNVADVPVFLDAKVLDIVKDEKGAAVGIVVADGDRKVTVKAKAVVDAAGGFAANNEMVSSYQPSLKGFATTNHPGATGDGMLMAERAGALLIDMKEIQTHPTYAPGYDMITEAVRGNGAILANREGARFINELATRDVVSAAVLQQKGKTAFLVFDSSIRKSLSAIEDYVKMGCVVEGATLAELAGKAGMDAAGLEKSVAAYNGYVAAKADPDFKRADMPRSLSVGPYFAIEITPAVHHTMGGVKINVKTEVLKADGSKIDGLYAAGEVTGGVHGGNRLGGNALADITTYGRIAGTEAAAWAKR